MPTAVAPPMSMVAQNDGVMPRNAATRDAQPCCSPICAGMRQSTPSIVVARDAAVVDGALRGLETEAHRAHARHLAEARQADTRHRVDGCAAGQDRAPTPTARGRRSCASMTPLAFVCRTVSAHVKERDLRLARGGASRKAAARRILTPCRKRSRVPRYPNAPPPRLPSSRPPGCRRRSPMPAPLRRSAPRPARRAAYRGARPRPVS